MNASDGGNADLLTDRFADLALNEARASRAGDEARAANRAAARKAQHRQTLVPNGSADPEGWRCFHTTTSGTRCSFDRARPAFKFCTAHTNGQLDAGATNSEMKFRTDEIFQVGR